jgi:hypothetical protein
MKFSAATLGMFVGTVAPLLELVGVDVRGLTLDKAEDFAALKRLGKELQELGEAGENALGDGRLDGPDLVTIFAEAQDLPAAAKALAGEIADQKPEPPAVTEETPPGDQGD